MKQVDYLKTLLDKSRKRLSFVVGKSTEPLNVAAMRSLNSIKRSIEDFETKIKADGLTPEEMKAMGDLEVMKQQIAQTLTAETTQIDGFVENRRRDLAGKTEDGFIRDAITKKLGAIERLAGADGVKLSPTVKSMVGKLSELRDKPVELQTQLAQIQRQVAKQDDATNFKDDGSKAMFLSAAVDTIKDLHELSSLTMTEADAYVVAEDLQRVGIELADADKWSMLSRLDSKKIQLSEVDHHGLKALADAAIAAPGSASAVFKAKRTVENAFENGVSFNDLQRAVHVLVPHIKDPVRAKETDLVPFMFVGDDISTLGYAPVHAVRGITRDNTQSQLLQHVQTELKKFPKALWKFKEARPIIEEAVAAIKVGNKVRETSPGTDAPTVSAQLMRSPALIRLQAASAQLDDLRHRMSNGIANDLHRLG